MVIDNMQNSEEDITALFDYTFIFESSINKKYLTNKKIKNSIEKIINSLIELDNYNLEVNSYVICFTSKIKEWQYADKHYLVNLEKIIKHAIYEVVDATIDYYTSKLQFSKLPNVMVEWGTIILSLEIETTLTNIHKLFKAEHMLSISNSWNVIGNVLGLFYIDRLSIMPAKEKWTMILEKHDDILECQEDFITQGLREYARL
jgi:hypothetical protein